MPDLPAVPDYYGQFMAPLQRQQQINTNQQLADAQTAQVMQHAMQERQKALLQQQFQADAQSVIGDPTPEGYRALLLKYPEFHDGLKQSWDNYSEARKASDVEAASQFYAALQNGRPELALQLLQDRKTAQANAGEDTKTTDSLLELVQSGDPAKIKQAQGIAGFVLANATGPDKIGSMLDALGKTGPDDKGQVVGRAIGHYENGEFKVDYRDPDAVQYRDLEITGPDGKTHKAIVAVGGDGQPTASAAPNDAAAGGFGNAVSQVLANEGGYAAKDMNGAPVNFGINQKANPDVKVKDLTRDQAIQIYHDRYWVPSGAENLPANMQTPYFDVYIRNPKFAKVALAKSGADPAKFMQLSQNYFQSLAKKPSGAKYASAWANRDAKNLAIATGEGAQHPPAGQPRVVALGAAADEDGGLDPATVTLYAQQILTGGQMPALGMGKSATASRQAIMNEVAKLAGADGMTGKDLAVQIGHYKANLANVQNLEKQSGTIEGNEQTALMNGQQFIDRSAELSGQTRFPVINSVTQSYLRHTGDPTVAAMDSAWNTFTAEYAKVVAGSPSGAGVLSDSARHEAMDTMRGNYSVAQKKAAFAQMKADMANRLTAIHNQIAKGYDSLGARAQGVSKPAKTVVRSGKDRSGKRVVQYSDGTIDYAN